MKKQSETERLMLLLERDFMYISEKYKFSTNDHNKLYDRISEILESISIDDYLKEKSKNIQL